MNLHEYFFADSGLGGLVCKVGGSNPGRVKSKTEKLPPVASLVSVNHLRPRARLVGPVSV